MAEALLELENNLRSIKEPLTQQEENFFVRYRAKALNQFTAGVFAGGGLVWAATWKLHRLLRLTFSGGAATILGFAGLGRSIDSSVDHVLALDGTRMQRELANIIVKKYPKDPWMMQLISKHFYLEEVFDDSTSEPMLRWRYQNFFGDYNVNQDLGTPDDSQDVSHNATSSNLDSKKAGLSSERIPVSFGSDLMVDPLDCVFGYTATSDEIHHSTTPGVSGKSQSRAHKRAHRRRRLRHHEGSLGSDDL
ncbi:hypothetical protein PTKIN_Ptkin17bG0058400 [Pterospermum kingtungense]